MKHVFLSHILENEMPVYGGKALLNIRNVKSIGRGDSANVFSFTMENHWGTHVDCPAHFFNNGYGIIDYPAEKWFFEKPYVVNLDLSENEIVEQKQIGDIPDKTDIVLIKTSFSRFRDNYKYATNNPGISPDVGFWLREKHPSVRAVGFDFISISSYQNRALGREAHLAFLNPNGINAPILIIEDMDLSCDLTALHSVQIMPLRFSLMDSAPCTIIATIRG